MTGNEILALPMNPDENSGQAKSVWEYLIKLLTTLIDEGECFSGKRPFGDSGWEYELKAALVAGGAMKETDSDVKLNKLLHKAIEALGGTDHA
jgi:hypothetical protein